MSKTRNPAARMIRYVLRLLMRVARRGKAALKSNKTIAGLLYDNTNVAEFTHLFSHERMLADAVRVNTYAEGIRRHIKSGDVVVDLGTGTGILAILAARQGATVYAIDHSEFIGAAEKVAKQNGVDTINFVRTHSKEFTSPEKVDVLLHEQIGDCLFEERMVENLLDLKQRLLKDTGMILPGRFEFFLEPVALKAEARTPFIWELDVQGIDFDFMRDLPELKAYQRIKYFFPHIEQAYFESFLAQPQPILELDLNAISGPEAVPTRYETSRTVVRPGGMAGLCLYFRVLFDDDIHFSTAPDQPQTHWGTRMFRTAYTEYAVGDVISYALTMGNINEPGTWSVEMK